MLTLGYETTFDAAHRLPGYNGPCGRLHGHTWKVQVELTGPVKEDGMIIDFHDVKAFLSNTVGTLDHQDLNNFIGLPTAEHLATYLYDLISKELAHNGMLDITLLSVTIWESSHSYIRIN